MSDAELLDGSACALARALQARVVSCRELMQATLARIDEVNPRVNAIVHRVDGDALLAQADERDRQLARGERMGWLHGLPQAFKDTTAVAGMVTTQGSPLLKDFKPAQDSLMVARMKAAGCIVIGRTNVPEFALGSHTYNPVYGATGNAYDPSLSAGGSSGGAAVALATGLLAVADGSDFMGSLRNPAGWNNVFGLRPSQGRVPQAPVQDAWINQLATEGPMARHVDDLAQLLAIQAGHDPRAPLALDGDGQVFTQRLKRDVSGHRIGWLGDLQGHLPMEDGVLDACGQALQRLQAIGCTVDEARLPLPPAQLWDCWLVWRQVLVGARLAVYLSDERKRAQMKPEALWEYDESRQHSAAALMAASATRTLLYQKLAALFERYDALALPAAQVWPFDIAAHWPRQIAGRAMDTYHRWMEVVIMPTLAGLPAISVPAGFNAQGLPMGLQLIGRPRDDFGLLQLAWAYEQAIGDWLAIRPAMGDRLTRRPPTAA
ncbi:amidase [Aquabacterium sp.]|uniref:amidase n=1 Tax=Aquabacterium sp. TaxID=1872578 RepID=UPI0037847714